MGFNSVFKGLSMDHTLETYGKVEVNPQSSVDAVTTLQNNWKRDSILGLFKTSLALGPSQPPYSMGTRWSFLVVTRQDSHADILPRSSDTVKMRGDVPPRISTRGA